VNRNGAFGLCAFLALAVWIAAAVSTLIQKLNVDKTIRNSIDISAIQIQQVNGSATTHALAALLIACAATIPLLIVAVSALVSAAEKNDEPAPAVEAPKAGPTASVIA
jgi:hypothetical protein